MPLMYFFKLLSPDLGVGVGVTLSPAGEKISADTVGWVRPSEVPFSPPSVLS